MGLPAVDIDDCTRVLLELLATPSPTGYTERALALVEAELDALDLPARRTPKGALLWTLKGGGGAPRAVACHIDTLGAMVKEVKPNGRVRLSPIGGYDWATIEGAECQLHTEAGDSISGTVVTTRQSLHVFGRELRELRRDASVMEVRLDAATDSAEQTRALGVEVGDVVSFDSAPRATPSGHVKGRHLDNKAAVAVALAVSRALLAEGRRPDGDVHVFVSNFEEVGHGAASGIPEQVEELLCIDMAAVGEGQSSTERDVTLCVKDSGGPYDPVMNRRLRRLAEEHDIPLRIDIYPHYTSDATAAWRAGGSHRAALIGPGVDASHSYERTHRQALERTAALVEAYLLAPIAP